MSGKDGNVLATLLIQGTVNFVTVVCKTTEIKSVTAIVAEQGHFSIRGKGFHFCKGRER